MHFSSDEDEDNHKYNDEPSSALNLHDRKRKREPPPGHRRKVLSDRTPPPIQYSSSNNVNNEYFPPLQFGGDDDIGDREDENSEAPDPHPPPAGIHYDRNELNPPQPSAIEGSLFNLAPAVDAKNAWVSFVPHAFDYNNLDESESHLVEDPDWCFACTFSELLSRDNRITYFGRLRDIWLENAEAPVILLARMTQSYYNRIFLGEEEGKENQPPSCVMTFKNSKGEEIPAKRWSLKSIITHFTIDCPVQEVVIRQELRLTTHAVFIVQTYELFQQNTVTNDIRINKEALNKILMLHKEKKDLETSLAGSRRVRVMA